MTTDTEKMTTNCFICSIKVGVSSRNSIQIFDDNSKTENDKPLVDTIRSVLEEEINEHDAHSLVLCKKCFKFFNEFDELETRMMEIKQKINENYRSTIQKLTQSVQIEEECNDHDYLDNVERILGDEGEEEEFVDSKDTQNFVEFSPVKQNDEEEHLEDMVEYLDEDFQEEEESQILTTEEYTEDPIATSEKPIQIKLEDVSPRKKISIVEPEKLLRPDKLKNDSKKKKDAKKKVMIMKEEFQEPIIIKEGSSYTCLLCPPKQEKVTGDSKEIIVHMRDIHEARVYICDVCGMDFRKRNELSVHLDDHVATEEGDFQCEVCNRIFGNLRLFRIHKRIHYPQAKSWSCQTCGKRYSSKNLLDEHVNTHIGVRPYICETCGKDFASKYTYKAHAKTHEIRERPFECHQCNKTFLSQQNLNQHERTHLGVKEYVCHQCGKAFGSPHNLEVHNIVHTGYKPYICGSCGKAFARKAEIRDHERIHTGEKPYQCEFCGATFSQRSNLQSHKRATHYNDKRYKCDDCGKGFKRRRLLDYHIKAAHTGERPYKCETCAATFVYPEHYKKHMRIHTGEKPYLCEVCGKAFNSRDNRNAHRFIHSDKKPYECLVCGTGFMRKPLLYAHMQSQGHLNDTIVVNQPRLTTEDDQMITLPEGDVELMMDDPDSEQLGETGLYVTELKDHVIIQQDGEHIFQEENIMEMTTDENTAQEDGNHVIVNAQIAFERSEETEGKEGNENSETVYSYNEGEGGQTIVVPGTTEYKELIGDNKNSVRLVQIRIPSSAGVDSKNWISLVQQHT